jgi:hypothetical protein
MLQQNAHKDFFLQDIENNSVHRTKDIFHKERFFIKDQIERVDMLSDPSLHDLLVLHNRSQRSKSGMAADGRRRHQNADGTKSPKKALSSTSPTRSTSSPKRGRRAPQNSLSESSLAKMKGNAASDQVRELCQKLDGNIQSYCVSWGVPEALGLHKSPSRVSVKTQDFQESLHGLFNRAF